MKKIYRVLVWGTGDWSKQISEKISNRCVIEAYIESVKSKECFNGIKVYSKDAFADLYSKADITLIAVYDSKEIIDYIESLGIKENVYYFYNTNACSSLNNSNYVEYLDFLFDESYRATNNEYMKADYTVCKCDDVNFLINRKYGMMIRDICCSNDNYQRKDMDLFIKLAKKYYGVSNETNGYLLDIGANIGTSSVWMKKKLLPNINIIGFEPVSENCKVYRINCILNGLADNEWQIVHAAVSDTDGICECMLDDTGNMGDNRIEKNGNRITERLVEVVRSITIDNYLNENSISTNEIKMVWMDVQAHEAFVLLGGENLFGAGVPLYMEFWPEQLRKNGSLELLINQLKKFYSKYIVIDSDCELEQLKEYDISELEGLASELENDSSRDLFLIK
jgi:FkbM family methyltransferase